MKQVRKLRVRLLDGRTIVRKNVAADQVVLVD
jgi:hypothetical protein